MLPDGKTLVGTDASDRRNLISEDITSNKSSRIGTLSNTVYTVLYDSKTRNLFAGDESGAVRQYRRMENNSTFSLLKDYGDIGVGALRSSVLVGGLAVFGGYNAYSLAAVKIAEQELCEGVVKTPFQYNLSLQVCRMSESRAFLSVSGGYSLYSSNASDVFNVVEERVSSDSGSPLRRESESRNTLFYGLHSEQVMESFLSKLFSYVETFFRNLTREFRSQLEQSKGKSSNLAEHKQEAMFQSRLSEKLQKVIRDFKWKEKGIVCVFVCGGSVSCFC